MLSKALVALSIVACTAATTTHIGVDSPNASLAPVLPNLGIKPGPYHITSTLDGRAYFVEGPVEGPLIVGLPKIGPPAIWDLTREEGEGEIFTFKSHPMADYVSIMNIDGQLFSKFGETRFKFLPAIVPIGSIRIQLADAPESVWELGPYNQTSESHMVFIRKIDLLNAKQLWLFQMFH